MSTTLFDRPSVTRQALHSSSAVYTESESCPKCGMPLTVRRGPTGPTIGCSGYPECKYKVLSGAHGDTPPAHNRHTGPSGETETHEQGRNEASRNQSTPGNDDKPDRHFRFWTALLKKANSMSTLHREVVASTADSIAAKANGIWYTYAIQNGMGRVDLYICRSNKAENKAIFDELARHKRTIESAFGHQLDWQRRDDNPNSRIASFVEGSALNEDGWDDLHRKMVARMVYLERVFSPYIDRYRRGESPLSAP